MPKIMGRIFLALIALFLILALAAAIYIPRATRASFPQIDGQINLEGLDGSVDIYRDQAGIPHIFASSEHDLFFAQGYAHAQDRFWQMDFQRHASSGRLSEMMGGTTLDTDVFLRTMGWDRIAREELKNLDARTLAILEAYAEGVNAYIGERENLDLSLEYLFLNVLNSNYEPAAWEPVHTLTWAKAMAWDLADNMGTEIQRAMLLKTLSAEQIDELYPPYPGDHPIIAPDFASSAMETPTEGASTFAWELGMQSALERTGERFSALDSLLGTRRDSGIGSNSWAVSGALSESGMPLLANDPHLGVSLPSIWYQNSLHCRPVGPDCSLEVSGVSFVGAPGVVIGHNADIAWGFTNLGPDVMDLYMIKVNPENENQYEMNGEWVDMEILTENVVVAGDENVFLEVRMTRFGPIISDSYGPLLEFEETAGMDLPENVAVALRWTALEPGFTLSAILGFNYAENWEQFREATRAFAVPSQNLIYADVDGNIGYQMPGNIPIRAMGDGRYPAPGWTDDYEWSGYIPFEELPFVFNPESGYIVTANNALVSDGYPYQIADYWDYGYRAQRIVDMLAEVGGDFSTADFQQMQMDNKNVVALEILPYLTNMELPSQRLREAVRVFEGWNGQQTTQSAPAALFNAFWNHLLAATFHDDLPEDYWPDGGSRWYSVMLNLLEEPTSFWWDNHISDIGVERRDDIVLVAFSEAVTQIEENLGRNPANWDWGLMHTLTFEHQVMSSFPFVDRLFNPEPFAVSGGGSIVNATSWDPATGSYEVVSLPSKRTIMDLSDWQNSLQIHTTGQSGHTDHDHYMDMAPMWAAGENLPMHWDLDAIQADAEGLLQLVPE